ncbi:MAG TPA: prepilin-type N-terminal cleavage/methylation domain-containing protein [Steroidobacteraceae bacterium]|jgi:MSHA biogenesis protein MshO|nr:prepilin-type N-terminal cleavage/methylation domain-containing protein [Steroidobacteraceae bacterium]
MRTATRIARGFTLVELVITIAVSSVVVAFMAMFIVTPMTIYTAQTRRAMLVDEADSALRFIGRDLRAALPNSVRVTASGSVTALELLATADGARYQNSGPLSNPALALDLTAADGAFATTVPFTQLTLPWTSSAYYLAIYNVGVPGADAYQTPPPTPNVITPAGTTITISAGATANQNLVTLSPAFQFAFGSPGQRVFLVSGPVSYLCDTAAATLTRYSGYTIASAQPASAAALNAAGATAALVAGNVAGCQFVLSAGTAQRNGLATLTLQITQSGESVQLLHQVNVVNAP